MLTSTRYVPVTSTSKASVTYWPGAVARNQSCWLPDQWIPQQSDWGATRSGTLDARLSVSASSRCWWGAGVEGVGCEVVAVGLAGTGPPGGQGIAPLRIAAPISARATTAAMPASGIQGLLPRLIGTGS